MSSGILLMNKPQGFTSFDVIAKLRGILKIRRLGHTGTLDPMAEGVLPVLVGAATKACDILPDESKCYRAGFRLGCVTDTQDSTGTVLSTAEVNVTKDQMLSILPQFLGSIQQIPPMYSAVQINGRRLYDLAREGKVVDRPARTVEIQSLKLLAYDAQSGTGELEITCGKGTYVRTVLHDIGSVLGCGCCMTSLVRTVACGFKLKDCYGFAEIETVMRQQQLDDILLPTASLFASLPKLCLSEAQARQYRNGVKLSLHRLQGITSAQRYAVYDEAYCFIGLASAEFETGMLRVFKNFEEH